MVTDLQDAARRNHDVLRPQISVYEACRMYGRQPGGDLRARGGGCLHSERTMLRHEIRHSRHARHELHDEILRRLPLTGVVHGRDVGMVDPGESGGLTPEAPDDALSFIVGA